MQRLSDLENSASCDASVRERIAALPPEVSDISVLDKIQGKLINRFFFHFIFFKNSKSHDKGNELNG